MFMLRKGIIKRGTRTQRQHHEPHVIPICVPFTGHGHMCLTTSCSTFNHSYLVDAIRGSHIRCSKNTEQVRERADELIQIWIHPDVSKIETFKKKTGPVWHIRRSTEEGTCMHLRMCLDPRSFLHFYLLKFLDQGPFASFWCEKVPGFQLTIIQAWPLEGEQLSVLIDQYGRWKFVTKNFEAGMHVFGRLLFGSMRVRSPSPFTVQISDGATTGLYYITLFFYIPLLHMADIAHMAHIMTIIQWLNGSLAGCLQLVPEPGGNISKVNSWDLIDEDPGELKDAPLEAYYYGAQAPDHLSGLIFRRRWFDLRWFPLKVLGPHPCTYGLGPEEMMLEVLKRHVLRATLLLFLQEGNIHEIEAVEDCASFAWVCAGMLKSSNIFT